MASPQIEDGYTKLANEIMEALMRTNLPAYQGRVLWAILRKTYGFQKKEDWISNSQLVEMTGLRKQHVSRTMKELLERHIVTRSGYKVGFNKDYTQWRELPRQVTVTSSGYRVTSRGDSSNLIRGTQKKKVFKETYKPFFDDFWTVYPSRNGKKLEPGKTFDLFCQLKPCEALLCIHAAKNYANSQMVRDGVGIRDPKRFLMSGRGKHKEQFWREWIEPECPEIQTENEGMSYIDAYKRRKGII